MIAKTIAIAIGNFRTSCGVRKIKRINKLALKTIKSIKSDAKIEEYKYENIGQAGISWLAGFLQALKRVLNNIWPA